MTADGDHGDVRVHHRGDRGVDGILRLIELAGHDGPIEAMLSAMCDEIAAISGVAIASVYVVEDDRLVMRGNHGFPAAAIGTVLDIGEGITGLVAECMRPVSAERAAAETAYKHIPGLGEEHFPAFVGVPLIGGGTVIGVLVLQRREPVFADAEVTLATALGAPVTLAIERRRASAVRSARLTGRPRVPGAVLGRAGVVPTSTALAAPAELDRALARLRDDLARATRRLADADDERVGGALDRFALALVDQRLREKLVAAAGHEGQLRAVVKEYARAPYRLGTVDDHDRVDEIEELCALIGVAADARSTARTGAVWIADRAGRSSRSPRSPVAPRRWSRPMRCPRPRSRSRRSLNSRWCPRCTACSAGPAPATCWRSTRPRASCSSTPRRAISNGCGARGRADHTSPVSSSAR